MSKELERFYCIIGIRRTFMLIWHIMRKKLKLRNRNRTALIASIFTQSAIFLIVFFSTAEVRADLKSANAAYKRGDYIFAFFEFRKLADRGNPKAQCMLANMYESGLGVVRDYTEAFKWYLSAAMKGDPIAQFMVAQMYYEGKGGPKDHREAAKWYRKAAEKGHIHAQNNMGVLYEYGRGVGESKPEALKWYLRAAEHGVAEAQYKAGVFYAGGIGVSQDLVRGYAWLDAAARNGNSEADRLRDSVAGKMNEAELSRAKELAGKVERKASK